MHNRKATKSSATAPENSEAKKKMSTEAKAARLQEILDRAARRQKAEAEEAD